MKRRAYRARIADEMLRRKLESSGAVLVEGAKWCGKTTTAAQVARSELYFNNPDMRGHISDLLHTAPRRLLQGEVPMLLDEWQQEPSVWDAVRFEVDQRGEFGQFILTGSAVPADVSQIQHSGTGRIARVRMRPMSLFESGESSGEVSLAALFAGAREVEGKREMGLEELAYLISRGGWPGALGLSPSAALDTALNYYEGVVNTDMSRVDGVRRSPDRVRALLRAYARSMGTQTTLARMAADIGAGEPHPPAVATVADYVEALRKIFVIEEAENWTPLLRSRIPMRKSPTRYFTDPSIALAALGAGPEQLMQDLASMGLFFENMAIRDLRVYAEALQGEVHHFLDKNGLEVDALICLRNGQYGLVEIKLGGHKADEGAATLLKFAGKVDTRHAPAPSFLMVLIGVGTYSCRRDDGVLVVPLSTLRP